jgi:hypothetical protein
MAMNGNGKATTRRAAAQRPPSALSTDDPEVLAADLVCA